MGRSTGRRNENYAVRPQDLPLLLNKCLLHFSDAQGKIALSAFLTFSVTYSHRKWWHIPVPREPLINQRFPSFLHKMSDHQSAARRCAAAYTAR